MAQVPLQALVVSPVLLPYRPAGHSVCAGDQRTHGVSWVTTGWWAQTTQHVRQHHVGSTSPARTAPLLYGALRRHLLWRSRWQLPGERRLLMGSTCNMVAHNVSHAHRTPVREATRTVTRHHRNSLHWIQHRRCSSSPPCKARYTTGLTHGGSNQSGQLDTCAATAPAHERHVSTRPCTAHSSGAEEHRTVTPPTQYWPAAHGSACHRTATPASTGAEYMPTGTGIGSPDRSGQYTSSPPHSICDTLPAGQ